MHFYLAPMEGITTYIYRNAVQAFYGEHIDKYYAPFIVPHEKIGMSDKDRRDLCPEHNASLHLVPQILTNNARDFCLLSDQLHAEYGYEEVNLNLGCPSKTVTGKGRGSGFLARTAELDHFLDEIYSHTALQISVKTRLGMKEPEEFEQLMEIYNRYPIAELTIHPRVQADYYNGQARIPFFCDAVRTAHMPLCYNGDISSPSDYRQKMQQICEIPGAESKITGVMIGRGMIRNPALISRIFSTESVNGTDNTKKQDKHAETVILQQFHDRLVEDYRPLLGDKDVLFRMKEVWSYMIAEFPGKDRAWKAIRKSQHLTEYMAAVREVWQADQQ